MHQVELIVMLMAVIAFAGAIAKQLRIALPILLVLIGMIISMIPQIPAIKLDPAMVFFIFLPPLLYVDSFNTPWKQLEDVAEIISLHAVGLVIVTVFGVAAVVHAIIPGMPWAAAFAFGAIVSPTDVVAALAIAEEVKLPNRLLNIIKGESLANDATGLVAYQIAVAAMVTGLFSWLHAGKEFLHLGFGGILLGGALGWLLAKIRTRLENRPVEVISSFLSPFIVYLMAENLHVSAVLAVVTAGLILGWYGPRMFSFLTRLQTQASWEIIAYILNGFCFLLMGLQLKPVLTMVKTYPAKDLILWSVAVAIAPILIRFIWTFTTRPLYSLVRKKLQPDWQHLFVFSWCGMRGVISLATALALPLVCANGEPFPQRELLIFLTIVVIISTLILQGSTLPYIVKKFNFDINTFDSTEAERKARLALSREAVRSVDEYARKKGVDQQDLAFNKVLNRYLEEVMTGAQVEHHNGRNEVWSELEMHAIVARRKELVAMRERFEVEERIFQLLQRELDLEEARCYTSV